MIYEKDENGKPIKTKNEFALNSVQYALGLGIRPLKVCFDSKFASNQLLNYLNDNNLIYFTQLASNRTFNRKQLKTRHFQPYTEIGKLKGMRDDANYHHNEIQLYTYQTDYNGKDRQHRMFWGI